MKTITFLSAAVCLSLIGSACVAGERSHTVVTSPACRAGSRELGHLMYCAGAKLISTSHEPLAHDRPILVATIVSIDDLNKSSPLGRSAAQLVASSLTQLGYAVQDVTYTHALSVKPDTGETVLSRDVDAIGTTMQAQAVVAGTYAKVGRMIYLNVRLIRADNGVLLSAADVVLPRDEYDPDPNTDPKLIPYNRFRYQN